LLRSRGEKSLVSWGFSDTVLTRQGVDTKTHENSVLLRNKSFHTAPIKRRGAVAIIGYRAPFFYFSSFVGSLVFCFSENSTFVGSCGAFTSIAGFEVCGLLSFVGCSLLFSVSLIFYLHLGDSCVAYSRRHERALLATVAYLLLLPGWVQGECSVYYRLPFYVHPPCANLDMPIIKLITTLEIEQ